MQHRECGRRDDERLKTGPLEESDAVAADPRYTRLLTAMAFVYGAATTASDYARAAYDALGLKESAA
ncbi:DUF6354 family protein [Streptomyces sp. NPDC059631]|uniref:DUF6354 family protein n=1 Tax=unclassified Streptomyces TaxID=2593676 RepID=UPI0036AECFCB